MEKSSELDAQASTDKHMSNEHENASLSGDKQVDLKLLTVINDKSTLKKKTKFESKYQRVKDLKFEFNADKQLRINDLNKVNNEDESSDNNEDLHSFFDFVVSSGKYMPAVSQACDVNVRPHYYNRERLVKAQETLNKWLAPIGLSTAGGMILSTQLTPILVPFLTTGHSRTVADNYMRITASMKYIKTCYETPFFDMHLEGGQLIEGWKSVLLIRGIHERVFKKLNGDKSCKQASKEFEQLKQEAGKPLWMNQYAMALFQFSFLGLFIVDPKRCGAHFESADERAQVVQEVAYYWRVLSYYLGIDDKCNIFSFCDSYEKQRTFLIGIFNHYKIMLNDRLPIAAKFGEGSHLAMAGLMKGSSFNILDHWWAGTGISFSNRKHLKALTLSDRIKMPLLYAATQVLLRSRTLMPIITQHMQHAFKQFTNDQEKIKKQLTKQYPNIVYELDEDSNKV